MVVIIIIIIIVKRISFEQKVPWRGSRAGDISQASCRSPGAHLEMCMVIIISSSIIIISSSSIVIMVVIGVYTYIYI